MKDNERIHDLEKTIRSLPEPNYDKKFTKDAQDIIHENLIQFTISYEKKKKRVTIMKKISLGLASVAALVIFAILTFPINEDRPSSSDSKGQTTTDEHIVDDEKETSDQNENNVTDILYENTEYGFTFTLPKSWSDYQIVSDSWEGISEQNNPMEHGPILSIRHPQWSEEKPRQDIPILIFTLTQWSSLEKGEFHIGAAPIGPTILGQNEKYVFALPARYNFAFLEGYEEVENILANHPLQTNKER